MSLRRLAMVAVAVSAVACGTQQASQLQPASVPSMQVGICGETACPWLREPGACALAAADLGAPPGSYLEVMILDPVAGTNSVTSGGATFSLVLSSDRLLLDWTATTGINFMIVSGTGGGNAYVYDPPATADTALDTVLHRVITGATFCYLAPPPPPPTLTVSKTASATFKRTWGWTIAKWSHTSDVILPVGASADATYAVTVAAKATDSDWIVTGEITVQNSAPVDATGVGIEDSFGGAPAVVICPDGFQGTIAAGATLTCTYTVALAGAFDGTNVATVTTTGPVDGGHATAPVIFGAPTTVVDECVSVVDDHVGTLGTACAAESPKGFSYTLPIGPYLACDPTGLGTTFVNTASFTAPSGVTGSSSWTVAVQLPCPPSSGTGCTLTQGYWKTHSREGPAPYDARWKNIGPLEEATPFFLSGKTWFQVFRTPVQGSVYYSLAHQYMAAKLNVLAGADPTALGAALSNCEAFFSAATPTTAMTQAQRAALNALASLLDDFNSGRVGPGHCDDAGDDPSSDGSGGGQDGNHGIKWFGAGHGHERTMPLGW